MIVIISNDYFHLHLVIPSINILVFPIYKTGSNKQVQTLPALNQQWPSDGAVVTSADKSFVFFYFSVSVTVSNDTSPIYRGNENSIMPKMSLHCETRDETVVSANKPCVATPSFPLYRQPNQHCCIFQNSTVGGERPKPSVQELYNLLRGWQGVISVIQTSYLGLWYKSKYIPSLF